MNRLDIINKVKQPAINVMKNRRILASVLIAESVLISEKGKDIIVNNPLLLRNPNTEIIYGFNSIEDCYNLFIDNSILENGKGFIIGNYDYKSLVKFLKLDETASNSIIEIIESYKLYEIDLDVIYNMYDGKHTIVEIDNEPFIDCYRIRKSSGDDRNELLVTFNKEEAIEECKKHFGYSVFNSRGNSIFSNELTQEIKAKMELEERVVKVPKNGSKVYLNQVNLYQNPNDKKPIRSITGFYYISSDKKYNNRYMITNKPEYVGNNDYILGYINDSDKR